MKLKFALNQNHFLFKVWISNNKNPFSVRAKTSMCDGKRGDFHFIFRRKKKSIPKIRSERFPLYSILIVNSVSNGKQQSPGFSYTVHVDCVLQHDNDFHFDIFVYTNATCTALYTFIKYVRSYVALAHFICFDRFKHIQYSLYAAHVSSFRPKIVIINLFVRSYRIDEMAAETTVESLHAMWIYSCVWLCVCAWVYIDK